MGAFLWKCPKKLHHVSLDSALQYALSNNYSYEQYQCLWQSFIPEMMNESPTNDMAQPIKEDLSWLEMTEKQLDKILEEEEGNLRDQDIDSIIRRSFLRVYL